MLINKTFGKPTVQTKTTMLVFLVLLTSACSSLTRSDAPAINTWWLVPLATGKVPALSASGSDQPMSVLIEIDVIPGLDTADILTLSPDAELSRFTGARWAGDLPELMRSLVGRSLEQSGNYEVVTRRSSQNLDRCQLRLQVRAFYAELSAAGVSNDIRIAMSGIFSCKDAQPRMLEFDTRVPVETDKIGTIVAAFQTGMDQAMAAIINRIQQTN